MGFTPGVQQSLALIWLSSRIPDFYGHLGIRVCSIISHVADPSHRNYLCRFHLRLGLGLPLLLFFFLNPRFAMLQFLGSKGFWVLTLEDDTLMGC